MQYGDTISNWQGCELGIDGLGKSLSERVFWNKAFASEATDLQESESMTLLHEGPNQLQKNWVSVRQFAIFQVRLNSSSNTMRTFDKSMTSIRERTCDLALQLIDRWRKQCYVMLLKSKSNNFSCNNKRNFRSKCDW